MNICPKCQTILKHKYNLEIRDIDNSGNVPFYVRKDICAYVCINCIYIEPILVRDEVKKVSDYGHLGDGDTLQIKGRLIRGDRLVRKGGLGFELRTASQ